MSVAPKLIIYGDFNCPFSALANYRSRRLVDRGRAEVQWRAIEHAPHIAADGEPLDGDARLELEREMQAIAELIRYGERWVPSLPARRSNTRLATEGVAALAMDARPAAVDAIFRAYWIEGTDISGSDQLRPLGVSTTEPVVASQWRDEWLAMPQPIVPAMVLPDGYVSRGFGVLDRLAGMLTAP